MEIPCIYCGKNTDRLAIVQYVSGSAGVIRPVCEACNTGKTDETETK